MKLKWFSRSLCFHTLLCWAIMLAPVWHHKAYAEEENKDCESDLHHECFDNVLERDADGAPILVENCRGEIVEDKRPGESKNENGGDPNTGGGSPCTSCTQTDNSAQEALQEMAEQNLKMYFDSLILNDPVNQQTFSPQQNLTEESILAAVEPTTILPPAPHSAPAHSVSPRMIQSVSLGKDSSGFALGNLMIAVDPNSADPIHIADAKMLFKKTSSIMDMDFHLLTDDEADLDLDDDGEDDFHQVDYITPTAFFRLESWTASGQLILKGYDLQHTTLDAADIRQPNPGSLPFMDLTVSRGQVNGQLGVKINGYQTGDNGAEKVALSYVSDHAPEAGAEQTIIQNGIRTVITDSYMESAEDFDGWHHLRQKVISKATDQGWVETRVITQVWQTLTNYREVLIENTISEDGGAAKTTRFIYEENPYIGSFVNKAFGKPKAKIFPDGSWEAYEYDLDGLIYLVMKPWLDGPAHPSEANSSNCWAKFTLRYPYNGGESKSHSISILGALTSTSSIDNQPDAETPGMWVKVASEEYNGNPITTTRYLRDADYWTTVVSKTNELGVETRYESLKGDLSEDHKTFTPDPTGAYRADVTISSIAPGGQALAGKTTRSVTVVQANETPLLTYTEIATQSGPVSAAQFQRYEGRVYTYDAQYRLTGIHTLDDVPLETHTYTETTVTKTDAEGIVTITEYDAVTRRQLAVVKSAASYTSAHGTHHAPSIRDEVLLAAPAADGSVVETQTRTGTQTGTPPITTTQSTTRDALGQVIATTDALGRTTTYLYEEDGRKITETLPSGLTRIRRLYLDRRLKSITGTAGPAEYHFHSSAYSHGGETAVMTTINYGDETTPTHQRITIRRYPEGEILSETTASIHPTTAQALPSTGWFLSYSTNPHRPDVKNHLDGKREAMVYNSLGELEVSGFMETGWPLTASTRDTYTETQSAIVQMDGAWWDRRIIRRLSKDNDANTALTTTTWRRLGMGANSLTRTLQPDGTEIVVASSINRAHALRTVTQTVTRPGGTPIVSTQLYLNGLLMAETQPGLTGSITHAYDGLERRIATTDPRSGTVQWNYLPDGRLNWTKDAGNRQTTYTYYPTSGPNVGPGAGLLHIITHPDNTTTIHEYDVQGRLTLQSGTSSYPVAYEYDAWGKMKTLKTWRDAQGNPDVTTWLHDPFLGILEKTDAANQTVRYTYHPGGLLASRQWARGVTTTYEYDFARRLYLTSYSDGTPQHTKAYDRLGRPTGIWEGETQRVLTYDGPGSSLDSENFPASETKVSYSFDAQGRRSAVKVLDASGTVLSETAYTHDPATDRIATISHGGSTATYDWTSTAAGLPVGISYSGAGLTGSRTPDTEGRLDKIAWNIGNTDVLSHDYTLNARGRRTAAEREDGTRWDYGYNDRGEVTAASHKGTDDSVLPGRGFEYAFDAIGNRTQASVAFAQPPPQTTTYTANALNQYTHITRTNPLRRIVQGLAHPEATIEVRHDSPTGQSRTVARVEPNGAGFIAEAEADTALAGVWRHIVVEASRPGVGVNGATVTTKRSGWLFFPPQNETLIYDEDGNLKKDARWLYTWDGENRLTAMEEKPIANASPGQTPPARKRLEFTYDSQSRRIRKVVKSFSSSEETFVVTSDTRFVHDAWNLLAELEMSPSLPISQSPRLLRTYAWGYDLSGTEQGAGGVGGLVLVRQHASDSTPSALSSTLAPAYDGNGNILAYLDCAIGSITQRMEYDAFGNEMTLDSVLEGGASTNREVPFRFSTKYTDSETSLCYYGYRYYSAEMGRWLNRDPIGEKGGLNLYGMILNRMLNEIDKLGLACGSGWSDKYVPDTPFGFDFTSPCIRHDNCYGTCHKDGSGSKSDCDTEFFEGMLQVCLQVGTNGCLSAANAYYNAVSTYGGSPYKAAQKEACKKCNTSAE